MQREKIANLTDEQVEQEIAELAASPTVKLAQRERQYKNRRRKYLSSLRHYERRGEELQAQGITFDTLKEMYFTEEDMETISYE